MDDLIDGMDLMEADRYITTFNKVILTCNYCTATIMYKLMYTVILHACLD